VHAAEREPALREQLGPGSAPADPEALQELARRQATILKYIDFRFRPLVRAERATRPGSGDAASGDTASGEEVSLHASTNPISAGGKTSKVVLHLLDAA